ncbi:MAG: hypothetical protein IH849_08410 [Acidobacteria bacterium]|nr:hypothetical protein [Acidobacteriota bacterium]
MDDLRRVLSGDVAAVDTDAVGLSDAQITRLYAAMLTTRALDERSAKLHEEGVIDFYVASRGIEAVSVGAVSVLGPQDWLFPSHRDVGMYLLRGGSMRSWFDQLLGNAADLTKGRQIPGQHSLPDGRFVSVSGRVGAQIAQAAGCAMAMMVRGDEACALASFGEVASAGADFHAGMNIAARFRAPVIFLCRSGVQTAGAEIGAAAPVAGRAEAYGVRSVRVDGSDALAVFQVMHEAHDTASQGGGPTLIEAVLESAAMLGDGPNDAGGRAMIADPVVRLRDYLEQCGRWDAAREEEFASQLRERLDEAIAGAGAEPRPPRESLFADVYEELPWMLQEQREHLLEEEDD